jgi:hypothetical protein
MTYTDQTDAALMTAAVRHLLSLEAIFEVLETRHIVCPRWDNGIRREANRSR